MLLTKLRHGLNSIGSEGVLGEDLLGLPGQAEEVVDVPGGLGRSTQALKLHARQPPSTSTTFALS